MKIIYVALENIEQRYTRMMNEALLPLVDKTIYPNIDIDQQIKRGQFLDIVNTCKFKSAQLGMIADMFNNNEIENGDVFLVGDIFFPGIEMIKYMSELQDLDVKVYGINYAGRADETDFVQKLSGWADYSEAGYHYICDGIFVGSEFHKENVCNHFAIDPEYVYATGYVWDLKYMQSFKNEIGDVKKENFVIWPHRWCNEKGIAELCEYAKRTTKKIIVTSSGPVKDVGPVPNNIEFRFNLSKMEYFTLMAKAKWYLSTAYQETQGYTILEAIFFGCNILVPDRACCPQMVPAINVYSEIEDIDEKFDTEDLIVPMIWTERVDNNAKTMIDIIKGNEYRLYNDIYSEKNYKFTY